MKWRVTYIIEIKASSQFVPSISLGAKSNQTWKLSVNTHYIVTILQFYYSLTHWTKPTFRSLHTQSFSFFQSTFLGSIKSEEKVEIKQEIGTSVIQVTIKFNIQYS